MSNKPQVKNYNPNSFSPDAAYALTESTSGIKRLVNKLSALLPGLEVAGSTMKRPANLGQVNAGAMYFDTTLGKPIWWNGTIWVDATGTSA